MILAELLVATASAQSCSCSVGATSDGTLPLGTTLRKGGATLALDYAAGQTGGEDWVGLVPATDRQGNSMAEMAMPGHLVHSVRIAGTYGATEHLSVTAALPYAYSAPLYPSDMPGDVAAGFLGDAGVTGRWAAREGQTFVGTGLGVTLPTGKVVRGSGVRGGRGAFGLALEGSALRMVGPVTGLAARASWAQSLFVPEDGYRVGTQLDLAVGTRVWTRADGPLSFVALGSYLRRGHDRSASMILDQTGMDCLSAGGGADWQVTREANRAVTLTVRGQVPLFQVVGDPWLTENWSVSGGATLGF